VSHIQYKPMIVRSRGGTKWDIVGHSKNKQVKRLLYNK